MKSFSLTAYSFSHFSVDYCCFWILFGVFTEKASDQWLALGFIVYNIIAFGLQMVIGAYCDDHRSFPSGALGAVLVFCAVLTAKVFPWAALLVTALGNAFFHVGGGMDSLVHADKSLSRCGIFVSTGALGVALGTFAGRSAQTVLIPAALAFASAVLSYTAHKKLPVTGDTELFGNANPKLGTWSVLTLVLISVFVRSLGGNAVSTEWKTTDFLIFTAAFAAFAGKFLGGFLADRFGARTVGTASLLGSLPLLIFGSNAVLISLLGILLFNIQMPITLGICAERLPKNPGLAFGLTTTALLLGTVPSFFAVLSGENRILITAVLISCTALFACSKNKRSDLS